jgi:uncharacterized protein YbcI
MVRILHEYTGRGPTSARTSIRDGIVTVLMRDTLIKAEQKLVEDGKTEMVMDMRRCFQRTMKGDLIASVEELTGRRVIAFMSDNHIDPDMAIEIFVLEPDNGTGPAAADDDGAADGAVTGRR